MCAIRCLRRSTTPKGRVRASKLASWRSCRIHALGFGLRRPVALSTLSWKCLLPGPVSNGLTSVGSLLSWQSVLGAGRGVVIIVVIKMGKGLRGPGGDGLSALSTRSPCVVEV